MLRLFEGNLDVKIVEKIEAFVSDYKHNLKGDKATAIAATHNIFDSSVDIPTANSDKCLEEFGDTRINIKLLPYLMKIFPQKIIQPSGYFMYPAEGGYMKWHTNSDSPYTRLYIVYATEHKKSCFKYKDPSSGEIITMWDNKGINLYYFDTPTEPLFWHCVYAECDRFSFGYRII